jgi:hypothetical protein
MAIISSVGRLLKLDFKPVFQDTKQRTILHFSAFGMEKPK